eukprot:6490497-Amphidinium_carterae.3
MAPRKSAASGLKCLFPFGFAVVEEEFASKLCAYGNVSTSTMTISFWASALLLGGAALGLLELKRSSKGGHALGSKCETCSLVAQTAFPLTPWDALLTQVAASTDVKALWDQAVQVHGQLQEKPFKKFPLDSFCTVSGRGY